MILDDCDRTIQLPSDQTTTLCPRQNNHSITEEGCHPCTVSSNNSVPFISSEEVRHGDDFIYSKVAAVKVIKKLEHYINRVFSLQEQLDENEISFNMEKSLRQSLEDKLVVEKNAVGAIKATFRVQNESSNELIEWLQTNVEETRKELVDSKACVSNLKKNHQEQADELRTVTLCESKIEELQAELADAKKKLQAENKRNGSVKATPRDESSRGRSAKKSRGRSEAPTKRPFKV
jgi:predicted RNA binding protein with dsRBD fold (UPF0201 family)